MSNGLPDMDFRFFNGASSGLVFPYLTGAEAIVTENLSTVGASVVPASRRPPRRWDLT